MRYRGPVFLKYLEHGKRNQECVPISDMQHMETDCNSLTSLLFSVFFYILYHFFSIVISHPKPYKFLVHSNTPKTRRRGIQQKKMAEDLITTFMMGGGIFLPLKDNLGRIEHTEHTRN